MATRFLAQNEKFIDELLLGQRADAPIIVTTDKRMSKYPDKKPLMDLYDMFVIQLDPNIPMSFTFRKPRESQKTTVLDHSDLVRRPKDSNDIVAGDTDHFISIDVGQLLTHYFTHGLASLEIEAGVKIGVDDIAYLRSGGGKYPIFQCKLPPKQTWDAVKWSPFIKGDRFVLQMGFSCVSEA